ncbi:hypothetical protein H0H92_005219 [Tricholoma furcatifolium]|nr:hypothetical protein H0H92_005219 [Tricholoma furcatifolium]
MFPDFHAPHKESRNVHEVREKIKTFLVSQGMIKGHSNNGSKTSEPTPTLNLREDSSGSSSPETPTISLDGTRDYHVISSMRDDPYDPENTYVSSSSLYHADYHRDSPPFSSQESAHDSYPYSSVDTLSVATASSFGHLYHFNTTLEEEAIVFNDAGLTFFRNPDVQLTPCTVDLALNHYREYVIQAQYLFAGQEARNIIYEVAVSHPCTRESASLLSSIHYQRFSNPHTIAFDSEDTKSQLMKIDSLLNRDNLSSGDAMAALHVVSSYLFDGGCGDWNRWIGISCNYVERIFSQYASPSEALLRCRPKDAFIIKTSIWFDVLASVTIQNQPRFLRPIRQMFGPTQSKIQELDAEDPSSMMSPMGCHNEVVWALAETSYLARWKQYQEAEGSLSVPYLVERAEAIQQYLKPNSDMLEVSTDIRLLASEIFRASARLYLRTVVSGDHPNVPEIKDSVEDVINCIQRLNLPQYNIDGNGQTSASRCVVRNTVFCFFICGAFAEEQKHRDIIRDMLDRESPGSGNSSSILSMLKQMWRERDLVRRQNHSSRRVDWRGMLSRAKILLV